MSIFAPIDMDLGLFYALVSAVCLIITLIILNRVTSTEYKNIVDKKQVRLFRFFAVFCSVDTVWGLYESRLLLIHDDTLMFVTYVFFMLSFFSAFLWMGYMTHYMKISGRAKTAMNIIRTVLLIGQLGVLISNIWFSQSFSLDEQGEYEVGILRYIMFGLQFVYYTARSFSLLSNAVKAPTAKIRTCFSPRSCFPSFRCFSASCFYTSRTARSIRWASR